MESIDQRLKAARLDAGYKDARAAATALGVKYPTYAGHENGERGIKIPELIKYADRYNVDFEWLARGIGQMRPSMVKLIGYVGAGPIFTENKETYLGTVNVPFKASPTTVAVKVRGDSEYPILEDGALLFYSQHTTPDKMLGKRCIVHLTDGSVYVKTPQKAEIQGRYDLVSTNAPTMKAQEVYRCSPIEWIKP